MSESGSSLLPLLKAGRRYRVLRGFGSFQEGRELNLLRASYSYLPYDDRGGWHLYFADAVLPLEQTEDAPMIARIGEYFLDVGPFDWRTEAAADRDRLKRVLNAEIEAVLRAQPASPDPMSPRKAYQLAVKRLRAKGVTIP
jgi:hypothetical protein